MGNRMRDINVCAATAFGPNLWDVYYTADDGNRYVSAGIEAADEDEALALFQYDSGLYQTRIIEHDDGDGGDIRIAPDGTLYQAP
jgi:hypothetical protein